MTQEYTPTDQQVIADYMPDEEDIGFDARTMSIGEWKRLKIAAFNRWLAAHDAQIRAEAMTFTDSVTRVTVVSDNGREYEGWNFNGVRLDLQDDGKTLKILPKEMK